MMDKNKELNETEKLNEEDIRKYKELIKIVEEMIEEGKNLREFLKTVITSKISKKED